MRSFSIATTLGILALALTASAAPAKKETAQAKKETAAPAKKEAWASGHIGSVDTAARSVVVKQGKHEMTFALSPDATLTSGATTIQLADLAADAGKPVKVRYTTNGTAKTADRVEVGAAPAPAPAKAPAAAKTPAAKAPAKKP
jgi:hypothetical protein